MKNPSSESRPPESLLIMVELRLFRYVVAGRPSPSGRDELLFWRSGDLSGRLDPPREDSVCLLGIRGRGESSVGVSDSGSTLSFEKALFGITLGGNAGRDFSVIMGDRSFSRAFAAAAAFDRFFLLAIRVS